MIGKWKKVIASAIIGASVLAASPANAGVVIAYYDSWPGNLIGYQVYCDSGALYEEYGVIGGVAIIDFVSVPC